MDHRIQVTDFYHILEETVSGYDGKREAVIRQAPAMFRLLTNLLEDPRMPQERRYLLNAGIAYFVTPYDVIPEEMLGLEGFIDDMFLASWVVSKLECEPVLLRENWEGDGDAVAVVAAILEESSRAVGDEQQDQILSFVGLGRS